MQVQSAYSTEQRRISCTSEEQHHSLSHLMALACQCFTTNVSATVTECQHEIISGTGQRELYTTRNAFRGMW